MHKCSQSADRFRETYGDEKTRTLLGFSNHYDAKGNRCYVEVEGYTAGSIYIREVYDSQEDKQLIHCEQVIRGKRPDFYSCGSPSGRLEVEEGRRLMNSIMDKEDTFP